MQYALDLSNANIPFAYFTTYVEIMDNMWCNTVDDL
jgi:hypothetical protein